MAATIIPIAKAYRDAIWFAVGSQVALSLLSIILLDGGDLAQVLGIAIVGYWAGAALVIYRHPLAPSRVDVDCVRWGTFFVFGATVLMVPLVGLLRG